MNYHTDINILPDIPVVLVRRSNSKIKSWVLYRVYLIVDVYVCRLRGFRCIREKKILSLLKLKSRWVGLWSMSYILIIKCCDSEFVIDLSWSRLLDTHHSWSNRTIFTRVLYMSQVMYVAWSKFMKPIDQPVTPD